METYKVIHGYYICDGIPTLQLNVYTGTRGHDKKLFKLQSHLDTQKFSFTVRIVSLWNSLPADIVNAPSVATFEKRLDNCWAT